MTIQCPECGVRYRIDPSRVGKAVARVKCPQCAALFKVSLSSVTTESPAVLRPSLDADSGTVAWSARDVLIVDDSSFFRELLADVLKPLHLHFLMAGDGAEALQIIRQKRPALVILDLNLPGMSGYDLIRRVRADPALGGLRLLAMSGVYRKETDAAEVHAAGADDFLSKSFNPEQLQLRVKKLLVDQE
jgi:predicted Zn finger-like uncharacterized protein